MQRAQAVAETLGAASEAAWYMIGDALAALTDHAALRRAVDEDRTTDVVRLSVDRLRERKARASVLTELQAHEAYLRNLRNYGLHPREDVDDDHEAAYTEAGCGLLLMQTHRYFIRLRQLMGTVGLLAGASEE